MHTTWQLPPEERLQLWRKFRNTLQDMDDLECLQAVVDWWKMAPIGSRVIDPYNKKTWPDPWAMLYEGKMDENAIALGMAYTLHFIEWPCKVSFIQDTKKGCLGLVVIVDGSYILNYNYGSVDKIEDIEYELLAEYSTEEL